MPYSEGRPILNCAGGSLITFGNMNRPVAASAAAEAAVNAPHATPIHARRPMSGEVSSSSFAAGAAAGFFVAVAAAVVTLPARSAAGTAGAAGRGGTAGRGCAAAAAAAGTAGAVGGVDGFP